MEPIAAISEWAARSSAPNALVVLALLTSPATWSDRLSALLRARLSSE